MGHSAGAHLVALLNARAPQAQREGAVPWLGAVALDSAVMNVPAAMRARHPRLHDDAFGSDPPIGPRCPRSTSGRWARPAADGVLHPARRPALHPGRSHGPPRAQPGRPRRSAAQALSHGEINARLGLDSDYTRAVETFMGSLDAEVARHLQ